MSSSQMEKYVWASVLYYTLAVVASVATVSIGIVDGLWGLVALFGYLVLIISLNAWRLRRHPRSAYQLNSAKQLPDR